LGGKEVKVRGKTVQKKAASKKAARAKSGPKKAASVGHLQPADVVPGEIMLGEGDIIVFQERATVKLTVANTGDRPIQVGSHCHFFEVNRALRFDREKAFGFRLHVPAGTAVRFEPGEEKLVTLVAFAGNREVYGINGLTNGRLDDPQVRARALAKAAELGFIIKG
jgi:urease beta subunit